MLEADDECGRTSVAMIRYVYDVVEILCCVLLICGSNLDANCIGEVVAEAVITTMNLQARKKKGC